MPRLSSINTFVLNSVISSLTSGDPEQANYQGATMVFVLQGSAPTGWVKDTSDTDYTLRCVTGTVASGGSSGFSSVMSSKTLSGSVPISGTVDGTSLDSTQIIAHNHGPYPATSTFRRLNEAAPGPNTAADGITPILAPSQIIQPGGKTTGLSGDAHVHPSPGTTVGPVTFATVNLAVKYVDAILATRT